MRDAIGAACDAGIAVILVTGRRLDDLKQVAGDLGCFDAIVAENGAVLDFPASGRHVVIGHAPTPAFVEELRRRGIVIRGRRVGRRGRRRRGRRRSSRSFARSSSRSILAFNRGRLMVLPQAIAKSTGLRAALTTLRLSIHNTVGIGDAENDHDLLDACEVGVAVEWGSPALRGGRRRGDPGHRAGGGRRTTSGELTQQPRLSAGQMGRRRLAARPPARRRRPSALAVRGRHGAHRGRARHGQVVAGRACCANS